jgi:hypothetical protein
MTGMKRSVVSDSARKSPGSDKAGTAAAARSNERRDKGIDKLLMFIDGRSAIRIPAIETRLFVL